MTHLFNLIKYGCILWIVASVGTSLFDMQTTHRYPLHAVTELLSLAGVIAVSYIIIRYSLHNLSILWNKIKWRR